MLHTALRPRAVALALLPLASAALRAQEPTPRPVAAAVAGTVYDSVARAPLPAATVRLVNAERPADVPASATTDSAGRFSLGALAAGRYLATFWHPRLDSLGLSASSYLVTVRDTAPVALALAIPGAARLRAEYCGAGAVADSTGVLLGVVRGARDRTPVEGGTVTARWLELGFVPGKRGLNQIVAARQARSSGTGWFALCGVPMGTEVTVHAAHAADTTGAILLQLPRSGVALRDFYVGAAVTEVVAAAPVDSTAGDSVVAAPATVTRRGTGVVTGTVRIARGGGLRGAQVVVAGTSAAATTDESGAFTLRDVPEGTQTLSARAVGYFPLDLPVDVFADGGAPVTFELASVRSVLDTIRVVGRRVQRRAIAAFEERQRARVGTFMDSVRIQKLATIMSSDLLRYSASMPVVYITDRRSGKVITQLKPRGGPPCIPLVYVDGVPIQLFSDLRELDTFVQPNEIRALEMYTGAQTPMEFTRFGACATVVITTMRSS